MDHLHLDQSYVLGSSMGSTIALAAARSQPRRLPRVIVQGGFARRPLVRGELFLARLSCYFPGTMRHLPLRERVLRRSHFAPFANRPPEVWQYLIDQTGSAPISATAYHALLVNRIDIRAILPEVRQPVLMICGDCDTLIGPAHEEMLLKGLPNAGRVTISGCGHMPSSTHPDIFAAVIRDFLTPVHC
jgi:pimeloyl-ACP methyl ester carboxylesterase